MERASKKERVLRHLLIHKNITPLEALQEYGAYRLSAIIYELRKLYDIETEIISYKNSFNEVSNFAKYILKEDK